MEQLDNDLAMAHSPDHHIVRLRWVLAVAAALLSCLPATTQAAEMVDAKIGFAPYRLGASTTVVSTIKVATDNGEVPSPVIKVELNFPKSLNLTSSTLGLAICDPTILLAQGQAGCPTNARMGLGVAQVAVPFGPEVVNEMAEMIVYMGPSIREGVTLLLYGEGRSPVYAQMLLQGSLVGGTGPFNELLLTSDVPIIPTLPGARDVAITSMKLTLGPRGLLYNERLHGRTVSFRPRGLVLPAICPKGGFPFTSTITFKDGTVSALDIDIPCPPQKHHAPRRRLANSSP
jgi:hypothetical protein